MAGLGFGLGFAFGCVALRKGDDADANGRFQPEAADEAPPWQSRSPEVKRDDVSHAPTMPGQLAASMRRLPRICGFLCRYCADAGGAPDKRPPLVGAGRERAVSGSGRLSGTLMQRFESPSETPLPHAPHQHLACIGNERPGLCRRHMQSPVQDLGDDALHRRHEDCGALDHDLRRHAGAGETDGKDLS